MRDAIDCGADRPGQAGLGKAWLPHPGAQARMLEGPLFSSWDEVGPYWGKLDAARDAFVVTSTLYTSIVVAKSPYYRGRVLAHERRRWGREKPRRRGRFIRQARRRGEAWAMTRGYL